MPRRPKPWYRRDRRMFYTTIEGKQHPLHVTDPKDEAGAWNALKTLIAQLESRSVPNTPTLQPQTVTEAVEAFLRFKAHKVAPITVRNYARHLARFVEDFGQCQIQTLDGDSVPNRAKRRQWSDTNLCNYLSTVEMCLKHAGHALTFAKPGRESAGADSVIPEAVYHACLRETTGDFHQYLRFLWSTGCRPAEAAKMTFDLIDPESGIARLRQHKTRGRTGRPRLVYLSPEAAAVVAEQRAKYQTGYLFRGIKGKPYSIQATVNRFWRLSSKVGHRLSAYDFRHTFATRALSAGIPDAHVSALLGHSNTTMIHRHYNHVGHNAKLLRDVAAKV